MYMSVCFVCMYSCHPMSGANKHKGVSEPLELELQLVGSGPTGAARTASVLNF